MLKILHLVGSNTSEFYYNLSLIYARSVLKMATVENYYAVINPQGLWQLGESLDHLSEEMSLSVMVSKLPKVDVVVPHSFCFSGMTSLRSFFEDLLGFPVVGSAANCTALASNKAHTRNIVEAEGVAVPKGQLVRVGDKINLQPPFIIKPNCEDNSLGLTLVRDNNQIAEALQKGFDFDETLLVEDYIPGREVRVGVIERGDHLYVPAMIEYLFTRDHPIRTVEDKYDLQADGTPEKQPEKPKATPQCPAEIDPELFTAIATAAKKAHIALGCRDYSLFDFRIHEKTGQPYLLEAGLFWSFGEISMISRMLQGSGESLEAIVLEVWQKAAKRNLSFSG